jgi:hypothetical protein
VYLLLAGAYFALEFGLSSLSAHIERRTGQALGGAKQQ